VSYITDSFDNELVRLLRGGGVGVLPTDTIYGLSCSSLNEAAVKRIHSLKRRDKRKPFVVLISDTTQLGELGIISTDVAQALRYWPGKLTIICEAKKAPNWLEMGTGTLAVRQPALGELRSLIARTGPIVSTSVNLAGQEPATDTKSAQKYFGDKLDFYVDSGKLSGEPSTIVKASFGKLEVLRPGAVKIN
jgi:L-threonylcarbamoyladenylate synthase